MSYNVAICTPPVPAEDDTAWDGLDSLINEQGAPPPVFRELHDVLTARYPSIRTLPDAGFIAVTYAGRRIGTKRISTR